MSMTDMPLLFVHGWGFGPEIWAPIRRAASQRECLTLDFGYFSASPHMALPERPFMAVGHSLGALWLLSEMPEQCRGMVLLNGFARFAASEDFPQGVPARLLTRMMRRLESAPDATVRDFRHQAGTDMPAPGAPQPERLHEGLQMLLRLDARPLARSTDCPIYCVAGTGDAIAPPALTQASFPPGTTIDWQTGGHLLPLTHPDACLNVIDRMMERITP
ncbi:alpha/beta hydrolase [Gluconacetobacter entanii]|uniref:Alpha/beta hydrolase n=2 Tax=Gluconacetobacter entanii TaxID=108528 RepID=A0ABT3K3R8_9PROT|nr:alpha/beta hydrolase [Gluconacetobacter entanii]MCW4590060.1 alpha/beta hydrolase [Gluconacetobacter entanii]MCW4594675.1 alpha/beta hydrolase [Gluconacetobacter entanii]NPC89354.1 alpha/beta fold hydrolase [Gluconacetobacter entanii]